MEKEQIINLVVAAVISGTVLNGIITHLLYSNKLKQEQRIKGRSIIGDRITEALIKVRDIGYRTGEISLLKNEDWLLPGHDFDFFNGNMDYINIFDTQEALDSFYESVASARREEERYLDLKTASYLYYIERYILQLVDYLHKNQLEDDYPLVGYVLQNDFINWQLKLENNVVKVINNPKYKLSLNTGRKWQKCQERVQEELWNESVLCGLINDSNEIRIRMAKALINKDIDKVRETASQYKNI